VPKPSAKTACSLFVSVWKRARVRIPLPLWLQRILAPRAVRRAFGEQGQVELCGSRTVATPPVFAPVTPTLSRRLPLPEWSWFRRRQVNGNDEEAFRDKFEAQLAPQIVSQVVYEAVDGSAGHA